jgi:primosomal protein N'
MRVAQSENPGARCLEASKPVKSFSMPRKATPSAPDLFSELEPPPAPVRAVPLAQPPESKTELSAADFAHRKLAEIAIDGPLRGTFTYLAEHLWNQLVPGARVLVPFGPRTMQGFFIGEKTVDEALQEGVPLGKLKPLGRVLDTKEETETQRALITPTLLDLAKWIARHYASPLGATLSAMLPGGVKRGASGQRIRIVTALLSPDELLKKADELLKKKPKQSAVLIALAAHSEPIAAVDLLQQAEAPDSALKALAKAKLLSITEERPREEDEANQRAGDGFGSHARTTARTRRDCERTASAPNRFIACRRHRFPIVNRQSTIIIPLGGRHRQRQDRSLSARVEGSARARHAGYCAGA